MIMVVIIIMSRSKDVYNISVFFFCWTVNNDDREFNTSWQNPIKRFLVNTRPESFCREAIELKWSHTIFTNFFMLLLMIFFIMRTLFYSESTFATNWDTSSSSTGSYCTYSSAHQPSSQENKAKQIANLSDLTNLNK